MRADGLEIGSQEKMDIEAGLGQAAAIISSDRSGANDGEARI
jgi:hypothetical protein